MALIICQDCGREISDLAIACPQCGRPNKPVLQIPEETNQNKENQEESTTNRQETTQELEVPIQRDNSKQIDTRATPSIETNQQISKQAEEVDNPTDVNKTEEYNTGLGQSRGREESSRLTKGYDPGLERSRRGGQQSSTTRLNQNQQELNNDEVLNAAIKAALIRGDITTPEIVDKRNSLKNFDEVVLRNSSSKILSKIKMSRVNEIINNPDLSVGKVFKPQPPKPIVEQVTQQLDSNTGFRDRSNSNFDLGNQNKIQAFKRRQNDGWIQAVFHGVPFIGIVYAAYYIFSRRTITPSSYNFLGIILEIGAAGATQNGTLILILTILRIFIVKYAITKARQYAKLRLADIEDSTMKTTPNIGSQKFCTKCGTQVMVGDKFCTTCGMSLIQ